MIQMRTNCKIAHNEAHNAANNESTEYTVYFLRQVVFPLKSYIMFQNLENNKAIIRIPKDFKMHTVYSIGKQKKI